ncbi:hypothetical protein PENTCL1PPCAC_2068, partial [Pristionchus entomophagus]
ITRIAHSDESTTQETILEPSHYWSIPSSAVVVLVISGFVILFALSLLLIFHVCKTVKEKRQPIPPSIDPPLCPLKSESIY